MRTDPDAGADCSPNRCPDPVAHPPADRGTYCCSDSEPDAEPD
jgi:hypothetical protein